MKTVIALAMLVASGAASAANATGPLSERASKADAIAKGHGRAGDSAVATSDASVSFEVLENGSVRRTNSKFNTVSIIDPAAETRPRTRR